MAQHQVTRLLVVTREPRPRVGGIISLRHLLTARRIDLHEEHHAERFPTLRARRATAPGDELTSRGGQRVMDRSYAPALALVTGPPHRHGGVPEPEEVPDHAIPARGHHLGHVSRTGLRRAVRRRRRRRCGHRAARRRVHRPRPGPAGRRHRG
ncbi:hypothetical protein [Streptomyces puniciscabiei]|uniref:hypothetical protein n=1 Tax=Streptomyces puniciscabiei TaxID=164348 RepID=UPI001FCCA5F1|nr:hypothetical protein [Streptomyces puniciscabiei]